MKVYRKVIPKIAKDVVRTLLASQLIEVEDGRRDEAELDVAAVLVEYLNQVEQIKHDASEALQRHGLSAEHLMRVKAGIAQTRGVEIGEGAFDFVINKIIAGLFDSKNIEEIYGEDHDIRASVVTCVRKYLGVDEELDREVRSKLKGLREGTAEWEVEYGRLIDHMRQLYM